MTDHHAKKTARTPGRTGHDREPGSAGLDPEPASRKELPPAPSALHRAEDAERGERLAVAGLAAANKALDEEIACRQALEVRLAAATRDGDVARHAAFHDPLTGLANRALFDDRLAQGLVQARRHGRSLAVMFIDLDNFKRVNDEHGHDAGDAVLRAIAGRLRKVTRGDDTVSRYGGDEFLYLLMETGDENDIAAIAGKIGQAIALPCANGRGDVSIRGSIGISIFPRDGTEAAELVRRADEAMYEAKAGTLGYAFAA